VATGLLPVFACRVLALVLLLLLLLVLQQLPMAP
jgi:hypothetical protein